MDTPSDLHQSNYKHHNTVKFLIECTPNEHIECTPNEHIECTPNEHIECTPNEHIECISP